MVIVDGGWRRKCVFSFRRLRLSGRTQAFPLSRKWRKGNLLLLSNCAFFGLHRMILLPLHPEPLRQGHRVEWRLHLHVVIEVDEQIARLTGRPWTIENALALARVLPRAPVFESQRPTVERF